MLPFFGAEIRQCRQPRAPFRVGSLEKAVEFARKRVAALAGATPREIVFTSGATESNNLAIKGVVEAYRAQGNHIVTIATEHRAVLDPVRHLEKSGVAVTVLPPQRDGLLDLDRLRAAIRPETLLVSVMWANNETGVIQPVREIAAICRERGVLFHCDAAQAFGKVPIDVKTCGIDLMSLSAHKIYGPKGVGALYVRRRVQLAAQMDGGGHESGLRSGTLNVPGIVGFGEASALCGVEMAEESVRIAALRDSLLKRLRNGLEAVTVNGSLDPSPAGQSQPEFRRSECRNFADESARGGGFHRVGLHLCGSRAQPRTTRSRDRRRSGALSGAFPGIGRSNTTEEIDFVAGKVIESVKRLRAFTPVL